MGESVFDLVEHSIRSGGPRQAFDLLRAKLLEEKNYPALFEIRLMRKRHQLHLPLIQTGRIEDLPEPSRPEYEAEVMAAAREAGDLFLADGDIPRAWPYFRAIGETAPIAAAIEQAPADAEIEPLVAIAFQERVHPRKGFEMILAHYGICRAISFFDQYPDPATRPQSLALLIRTLHGDLVESLQRAITQREGSAPDTRSVPDLIEGRDWLFGEYDYYVDTSHLVSILRFSFDADEPEILALATEMTEYGKRLSTSFQFRSDPPFENLYEDGGIFLRALQNQNVEQAIAHFQAKISGEDGPLAAQVLVGLLARLDRFSEAIDISSEHLRGIDPARLMCPPLFQLCQLAGDYTRMRALAREEDDILSYTAAALGASQS